MSRNQWALIAGAAASTAALVLLWHSRVKQTNDKESRSVRNKEPDAEAPVSDVYLDDNEVDERGRILQSITIVHGSVTGRTEAYAKDLYETLKHRNNVQIGRIEQWDWWDELLNEESTDSALLIILLPTYTNGEWPPSSMGLRDALSDLQNDWRIQKHPLKSKLRVAIFGMGSSEYDTIGKPSKEAARHFGKLGARVLAVHIGDDAVSNHADQAFKAWKEQVLSKAFPESEKSCCNSKSEAGGECCQNGSTVEIDDYPEESEDEKDEDDVGEPVVIDLEDMGDAILASQQQLSEPREMVTPAQAAALKKEGYKLIGTHSAVKLCRWTKHQLRGRGGCYKHTFYGITSYQCMEATPSLACANKCVFCWRHHKNPVGKEWRWKTDDPGFIVEQAVQTHVKMIQETKGIPGVQMDRWKEAHTVRHCALSLVGEPIMYPRINELLGELHQRNISTFLVTNGQHPPAIASLRPITQLYVSVDAPTKDSLIAIDRPLFVDAWERLRQSLSSLKQKGQRTVARLTVVKGWNSDEISGYAELIALGLVSLIEVKGVTFCGKSDASNLNMSNTPWHHEVVDLAKTLKEELARLRKLDSSIPEYDLACEHKHSCSVLLARVDQFAVGENGSRQWRTWIDYDKFQELAVRHAEDPTFTFTVTDYTAETPSWALFGASEEGFDPTDQRHYKKRPKYTQFDDDGIPTHDSDKQALLAEERGRLRTLMEKRRRQIGDGSTVTELKDGSINVADASLMFRGLVVTR